MKTFMLIIATSVTLADCVSVKPKRQAGTATLPAATAPNESATLTDTSRAMVEKAWAESLQVGSYVHLSGDERNPGGFLRYTGEHGGVRFCALSADIGSAIPSQDLRLYAEVTGRYQLVLSLPMLNLHGYRCTVEADTLNVYLTRTGDETVPPKEEDLMLKTNLLQFVFAHTESAADRKRRQE
jgi:hypothetical protein